MKKLFASALSCFLALSVLASCGGPSKEPPSSSSSPGTTASAALPAGNADSYAQEPELNISLISTFNTAETGGMCVQYFMDYITEATDGKITFTPYFGGTMASTPEELEYISSGSVDMGMISLNAHGDVIPLANIPTWFPAGMEAAVEIYNYVMYENEETAALVRAQTEAAGVELLPSSITGGSNAFFSTKKFSSLADFKGLKAGVISNFAAYETLGMATVTTFPPDAYENLSRGVSDVANMGVLASYAMRYHEVAPYVCYDGQYSVGNAVAVNLAFWKELPTAYQELLKEAMAATKDYSIQICSEEEADIQKKMVEEGANIITLSEQDKDIWFSCTYDAQLEAARNTAKDAGAEEGMELMLAAMTEKLAEYE